jgi:alginate O-acetyltransferase complex protein AlgI
MTFTSLSYFLFLPAVYLAFYVVTHRFRWMLLLAASYAFYATFKAPQLLLALALVTVISYAFGIRLGRIKEEGRRKRILWLGVAACLLILALIKYLPLLWTSLHADTLYAHLLISIGVSYFTFQAISYLADIYLEIQAPEQHFGYHALALAFFPKLLQGPIERAGDLLPQLKKPYAFDYDAMRSGMMLFTWGLFKKLVVADRLALYANTVYNDVHHFTGLPLIIATYVYALQIYFDFAGYTDMARGTARMFGIGLSENFNSPYLATSIADFWRRWHISFSRWILDYIFKPLQMTWRDHGQAGTALALIITFLASGIWHGASWGFVVWGLLHGIYLASSTYYRPYQKKLHKWMGIDKSAWLRWGQVFVTFNFVSFAFIFFRSKSLGDAFYVLEHLGFDGGFLMGSKGAYEAVVLMLALAIIAYPFLAAPIGHQFERFFTRPVWTRWLAYAMLLAMIVLFSVGGNSVFVYFQF